MPATLTHARGEKWHIRNRPATNKRATLTPIALCGRRVGLMAISDSPEKITCPRCAVERLLLTTGDHAR